MLAYKAGFRGARLDHISLAMHQTAVNAIYSRQQQNAEKEVQVEVSIADGWLQVRIADEREGFDPKLVFRLSPEDLFRTSGRRVFYRGK